MNKTEGIDNFIDKMLSEDITNSDLQAAVEAFAITHPELGVDEDGLLDFIRYVKGGCEV